MAEVRLENLAKLFKTRRGVVTAVDDVSLTVASGELFFLLGPSGCGKTTLLRMLAGFVEPSAGRIFFGGRDVTRLPPEKRDTAMVFQNYALWPHMTVRQNVSFGLEVRHVPRSRRRQAVEAMLQTVRVADKAGAKPLELSGGQQQRVALARALAVEPALLLLDEPLSNLDAALRAAMRWEIRRVVKAAGATAVYVTHDQAEALAIADRIAVMQAGKVVQVGTGRELYESPANAFVAGFLGEANFVPGEVVGVEGGRCVVQTRLGPLRGRLGGAGSVPRQGQKVSCCIRPEHVRLAVGQGGGPAAPGGVDVNVIPARLTEWVHLGDSARFRLLCAGGVELSGSAMPARAVAAVGSDLAAAVAAEDIIIVTGLA